MSKLEEQFENERNELQKHMNDLKEVQKNINYEKELRKIKLDELYNHRFKAPKVEKNVERVKSEKELRNEIEEELIKKIQFLLSLKVGDSFVPYSWKEWFDLNCLSRSFNIKLSPFERSLGKSEEDQIIIWRVE